MYVGNKYEMSIFSLLQIFNEITASAEYSKYELQLPMHRLEHWRE